MKITFVVSTIFLIILPGWFSIIVALEGILEILKGIVVKVALTMVHKILDVFLWERIEKDDFGFLIVHWFFITVIQEFDGTQCFLETGVKG